MQAPGQEVEAIRLLVLLAAIAIVAFWRPVVRWLILLASSTCESLCKPWA